MSRQNKFDQAYMRIALEWSKLSQAKRKQVGCLIVKNNSIIADGFNGTPSGMDNECEGPDGKTLWYVLHAEANALSKIMKSTQSSDSATLYTTLSPCKECSKLILQSGIKRVVYLDDYKCDAGIDFLRGNGVEIEKIELK